MVPTSAPCKSRSLATAAPPPEAAKWSGEDLQRERTPKADKVAANSSGRALIMSRRPHRRRRHAIAHDVHDRWGYNGCSALLTHPMLAPHRRGMHSGHTHAPGTLARTHARASSCFVFFKTWAWVPVRATSVLALLASLGACARQHCTTQRHKLTRRHHPSR